METEAFFAGQRVYYVPPGLHAAWTYGCIEKVLPGGEKLSVIDEEAGTKHTIPMNSAHGIIDNAYDPNDPDLFRIGDLHVATLLHCLKARTEGLGHQYSKMGEMILSVNPFQRMPFNMPPEREKYLNNKSAAVLPPHIWQIADKSFTQIVVRNQGNQSVVISGESGSGKTENTKMLIDYLGCMSHKRSCNATQKFTADKVNECLKWSNPVLESFGNARTVRNDNSSRFGKYIKLFFDSRSGVMVGGEMVTYLLEKSRIIHQGEGERNYHVFYEMLAGLTPQQRAEFGHLKSAKDYACLNAGGILTRRGVDGNTVDDAAEFRTLQEAMSRLNISKEEQHMIFRVLAAILHLQELEFDTDANEKALVRDTRPLTAACTLLGVVPEQLQLCFLEKSRTKILTTLATPKEAEVLRDAFSKALYVGLFDTLVDKCNAALKPEVETQGMKYIGVLDIFGFENFAKNSFEQLCINYANEGLQNHYNRFTFINDEEECNAEGIPCPQIEFPDNQPCLDMFDSRTGVFALLDEACNFKGGTHETFTTNAWNQWSSCPFFIKPRATMPNAFGIHHYAADVMYNTEEWLEKNADALKEEARIAVQQSSFPFIRTLLDNALTVGGETQHGAPKKKPTVATRFKSQLISLRKELESTESHFIRCIKPNMSAAPSQIENGYVGAQLESAGVLGTIALKRQGYPIRRFHKDFTAVFLAIAPRKLVPLHRAGRHGDCALQLLNFYDRLYCWERPHYAVGKTKVFIRANVWNRLEKLVLRKNRYRLKRCVPFLRRWVAQFRERKAEEERRRLEEQRKMQQTQKERPDQQNLLAAGVQSGLTEEKSHWFQQLATAFPRFDLPIIADVAYNLGSLEAAARALAEMQQQRLDRTLPGTLKQVFAEIGVRAAVAESLASSGICTLATLMELSKEQMKSHNMNEAEIAGLTRHMIAQQSEIVVNDRLREMVGPDLQNFLAGIGETAAQQPKTSDVKLTQLKEMGFSGQQAKRALEAANGNVEEAAVMLSTGNVPSTRAPPPSSNQQQQQQRRKTPPPAPPTRPVAQPQRYQAPTEFQSPPPMQRQLRQPPPLQQRPAPVMGTMPQGGYQQPPQFFQAQPLGYPPQQQQQQQAMRVPPPQQQQQQQHMKLPPPPGGPAPDERAVRQLQELGFPRERCVQALQDANGDVRVAANLLLS